jgi:hypothetical protein
MAPEKENLERRVLFRKADIDRFLESKTVK